jgi:hypothetical protein
MGTSLVLIILAVLAVRKWQAYGRPKRGFLPDFATLLDSPEFVNVGWPVKRSFLKGQFRGRKVVVLLQHYTGRYKNMVVVSMETHATVTMENYDLAGYRPDRQTELARIALQERHELRLRHADGCLKVRRQWHLFANFPPPFEPEQWGSILDAMYTVSGSLERRAA